MKDVGHLLALATISTPRPPKPKRIYTEEQKQRISARQKIYYDENRELICEKVRDRRTADPERHKSLRLKQTYGITASERDDMFKSQGSVCAICKSAEPKGRGWQTDHCHVGGQVRGILCLPCNALLGMARDNPATLAAAITYLSH